MKTKIIIFSLLLSSTTMLAQWNTSGNTVLPSNWLGTQNTQPLNIRTNGVQRMRLMQNSTLNVDGYNINNSGFLGLSIDPIFFSQNEPFSLLHLNGEMNDGIDGAQVWGYRDWMKPGIVFTHNKDFMYIGPKANSLDKTDAVIAWSDNPGLISEVEITF